MTRRRGNLRLGHSLTGEASAAGLGANAGDLPDAGPNLPAVQQLMGHASPSMTSRYDRRAIGRAGLRPSAPVSILL